MIKPIVKWPHPVLLTPTARIDLDNPPVDLLQLEADLVDTLREADGLGLAANQIGVPYRAMAILVKADGRVRVMYNPEILYVGDTLADGGEGCLSYPGVTLNFPRPKTVTVRWQDRGGEVHSMDLTDIDARCALHEIDHLDGIFFKSKVSQLKWSRAAK